MFAGKFADNSDEYLPAGSGSLSHLDGTTRVLEFGDGERSKYLFASGGSIHGRGTCQQLPETKQEVGDRNVGGQ